MCLLEGANEKKKREERRQSKCEKAAVGKIRKMTKRSVGMCVWVCLDGSAKQCWQDVLTGPFGTVEVLSVLINEALYPILHGPIKNWPGVCCTFLLNISSGWSSSRFIDYRKASKSLFLEPGRNGEVERTRTQQPTHAFKSKSNNEYKDRGNQRLGRKEMLRPPWRAAQFLQLTPFVIIGRIKALTRMLLLCFFKYTNKINV